LGLGVENGPARRRRPNSGCHTGAARVRTGGRARHAPPPAYRGRRRAEEEEKSSLADDDATAR